MVLKKCSNCRLTTLLEHFDLNNKGEHYKSCNECRAKYKERYQSMTEEKKNEHLRKNKEYEAEHIEEINERKKEYIQNMNEEQKQHLREKQKIYRQRQQEKLDKTRVPCPRCGSIIMSHYMKTHQKVSELCLASK